MLFLLSLGCLPNLSRNGERPDGEDTAALDLLTVESVAPAYATTLGGTEATLTGGLFDGSARVFVGGEEAQVLLVSGESITFSVPAVTAGMRDVSVVTDEGEGELESAIRVFEDGTGQTGAIGAIEWYELQGSYWSEDSQDFGNAWWGLIEPQELHYWDLFGAAGDGDSCVSDPEFPGMRVMDTGLAEVQIVVEGRVISMDVLEDRTFDGPLADGDFKSWATYGVSLDAGELPAFEIEELARTGGSFDLYAPYLYGSAPPVLTKTELEFEWGNADADRVILWVERYDQSMSERMEVVACVTQDSGSFKIPADAWADTWDNDQWLYIYVGAVREDGGIVPLNNSFSNVAGVSWLLGAATTSKGD
ncbi:MAG: hypothetical protein GY913_29865 [Proteobacteria bacterium]|nr:hypothetical protein [Pseudomonadota bacterium]MCP4921123.1 hypothetical protein [Pseudomonadota bacterium]